MSDDLTSQRKDDHIHINLEQDVSFDKLTTGLEHYRFVHQALPELDLEEVSTETTFLEKPLGSPLLIASMTGGSPMAAQINRNLAEVAREFGLGMGLGSMRAALEQPDVAWSFKVRTYAPHILLLANLGAVQLNYAYGPEQCLRVVEMIEADGLILHLNPLQEALQPEGNTHFKGLLKKIEQVCHTLKVPVIVKEVGWGLSAQVARQLIEAGVAALDVAGAGGTSWSQVEMYRSRTESQRDVAAVFRDWGLPTAESIREVRKVAPEVPLIASGGITNGLEIAKALALGADAASLAGVLLRDAAQSVDALRTQVETLIRQLRIAMFASGAKDIPALKQMPLIHEAAAG